MMYKPFLFDVLSVSIIEDVLFHFVIYVTH